MRDKMAGRLSDRDLGRLQLSADSVLLRIRRGSLVRNIGDYRSDGLFEIMAASLVNKADLGAAYYPHTKAWELARLANIKGWGILDWFGPEKIRATVALNPNASSGTIITLAQDRRPPVVCNVAARDYFGIYMPLEAELAIAMLPDDRYRNAKLLLTFGPRTSKHALGLLRKDKNVGDAAGEILDARK